MSLSGGYNHVCATADGTRLLCSMGRWNSIRVLDRRPLDDDPRRLATQVIRSPPDANKPPVVKSLNIKVLGSFVTDTILEDQGPDEAWITAPDRRQFVGIVVSAPVWLGLSTASEFK